MLIDLDMLTLSCSGSQGQSVTLNCATLLFSCCACESLPVCCCTALLPLLTPLATAPAGPTCCGSFISNLHTYPGSFITDGHSCFAHSTTHYHSCFAHSITHYHSCFAHSATHGHTCSASSLTYSCIRFASCGCSISFSVMGRASK